MSAVQKAALGVLLFLIAGSLLALSLLGRGDQAQTAESGQLWTSRIATCAQQYPFDGHIFAEGYGGCVLQVWRDAVDTGQIRSASAAFLQAQQENPSVGYACHRQGHYAGIYALEIGYTIDDILVEAAGDQCGGGFVHGALGAYATSGIGPSDLARVAGLCAQQGVPASQAHCTHGVGHAAWVVAPEPGPSILVCNAAGAALAEPCLSGLFMQVFRPDDEQSITADVPTMSPAEGADMLTRWCTTPGISPAIAGACWQVGFSQVLTLDAMTATESYLALPGEAELQASQREWQKALDSCRIAPSVDLAQACREWVATSVTLSVIEFPEALAEICPAFPKALEPFCDRRKMAEQITADDVEQVAAVA